MSKRFRKVRPDVIARDDNECRFCGKTNAEHNKEYGRSLDVHHIIPTKAGGTNELKNLITVCMSCHKTLENTQGKAFESFIERQWKEEANERLKKRVDELESGNVDGQEPCLEVSVKDSRSNYVTLNTKKDSVERLKSKKQTPRESYDDLLNRLLDLVEQEAEPTEPVPIKEVVGREVLIDELSNIEAAVKENTNKVEQTKSLVEDLGGNR